MKKSIIAIFALSVASVIQATQVNWTSGNLASAVANAKTLGVSGEGAIKAYYYVLSGSDTISDLDGESVASLAGQGLSAEQQKALFDTYFDKTDTIDPRGGADATSDLVKRGSTVGTSWNQTLAEDTEEYVLTLYVADTQYGGQYALAAIGHHVPTGDGEFEDYEREVTSGLATMAYANAGGGWTAVPEPTTVALLALGLAAVGMKRKVA
ncbi:MAG: PEP-CTERM sorting domain-containing protein [Kiritimatiellae bacterium]|nr:PEP-CTERM sorting domain-containing protein [Kiritimatiellia bacterium]